MTCAGQDPKLQVSVKQDEHTHRCQWHYQASKGHLQSNNFQLLTVIIHLRVILVEIEAMLCMKPDPLRH